MSAGRKAAATSTVAHKPTNKMPNAKDVMLSVAQVCQLEPGDENNATWINPGFTGVIREITQKKTKTGKAFFPCTIADVTGPETIEVSFFTAPKFSEGDVVDIFGQGLRRTEYNGKAQAALGKATEVRVVGQSAHEPEQRQLAAAGQPAVNGQPQHVNGQTVGMALKEALAALKPTVAELATTDFWAKLHAVASDIIRVSQLLEKGKLADPVRERANPGHSAGSAAPKATQTPPAPSGGRQEPPKPAQRPQAGPGGSVAHDPENDDQIPF